MGEPAADPATLLAAQQLVCQYFAHVDARDVDAAIKCYTPDAVFLEAQGRSAIRKTMLDGLAANADKRTRHVIANLRASGGADQSVLVAYTALAYTVDGPGPYAARSILDQQMVLRRDAAGALSISEHRIFGYDAPSPVPPPSPS